MPRTILRPGGAVSFEGTLPEMAEASPLTELADGVYVWLTPNPGSGRANAGVILDDDGITVVDTLMVRSQWEPFSNAVRSFGLPVRRVIVTSARIDFVGGTRSFPHAALFASPQASDTLDQPMPVDAYRAFMPEFDEELIDLGEFGTRPITHLVTDPASLSARVEVVPASGHTNGDVMVIVEDADVLFAGGICSFGVTPLGFQSDFTTWQGVLSTLPDLAETIVPGHGKVGRAAAIEDLRAYLRACVDADGDPSRVPAGPWDAWSDRRLDVVNVERAALQARGDDTMPPSMLRLIGLA